MLLLCAGAGSLRQGGKTVLRLLLLGLSCRGKASRAQGAPSSLWLQLVSVLVVGVGDQQM
jgi:hypothetical protein